MIGSVRLLEGSESEVLVHQGSSWVTEERKQTMQSRLRSLRSIVEHLLEHMGEGQTLDREVLKEVTKTGCMCILYI
jgi:hypothetical protein